MSNIFGDIIGVLIAGWMVLTGHYPFNLDVALSGLRTRKSASEPSGDWVRISGASYLLGFLLLFLGNNGVFPGGREFWFAVYYVFIGIAIVSLLISFIRRLS